jgi:predicted transcriptional regulator
MYTSRVKRIQIYIDDTVDEQLSRRARRERRSKAALIREAVSREYFTDAADPFDAWAGGIDEAPGDIDDVVYRR